MSKSDTDSNSESYKSLSDEDYNSELSAPITPRVNKNEESSEVDSSDETVIQESNKKMLPKIDENVSMEADSSDETLLDGVTEKMMSKEIEEKEEISKSVSENGDETSSNNSNATTNASTVVCVKDKDTTIGDVENLPRTKYSRGEKKARRLLIKQGSKPLPNISRLVMRQGTVLFVIEDPEIYKNPRSDTFIVFGEVKIQDLSKQQENLLASNQFKAAQTIVEASKKHAPKPSIVPEEEDVEEALDETGIDPTDIDLVMCQASTTRVKAVRALKAHNNDIVNAIMELTMV